MLHFYLRSYNDYPSFYFFIHQWRNTNNLIHFSFISNCVPIIVTVVGRNETETPAPAMFRTPVSGVFMFQVTAKADGNGAVPLVLFHNDTQVGNSSPNVRVTN